MAETAPLTLAIHDAEALLAYAAQTGALKKDEDVATPIVEIKRLLAQNAVTEESEVSFWRSLSALSAAVRPVTADSLRATNGVFRGTIVSLLLGRRTPPAAERAVRRYRRWAMGTLLCLVAIQIYYLVGSTVIADIERIPTEVDEVHTALLKAQRQSPSAASTSGTSDEVIGDLLAKEDTYEARLETSYGVLAQWNQVWLAVISPWSVWHGDQHGPASMTAGASTLINAAVGSLGSNGASTHAASVKEILKGRIITETTARFALSSIQSYLLPFLYGFLGTCLYILRSLSSEIKSRSFSSEVGYRLRMPLGALAGVAVAWFITPETTPALVKSLSPLALAFLAGYSVEVLFSGMDRFISAFSTEGGPTAKAPSAP
jgi:hypothetical protein